MNSNSSFILAITNFRLYRNRIVHINLTFALTLLFRHVRIRTHFLHAY